MRLLIEKLKKRLHRPWFGSGIGAVLVPIFGVCLLLSPMGKGLRDWSYDLPFLLRAPNSHNDVVIVGLDDGIYKALDQDRCTFDRSLHGRLVKRLNEQGAKLVVFDIVFLDPLRSNTNGTAQFAAAMLERSNVVLAAQYLVTLDSGARKQQVLKPTAESLCISAVAVGLARVDRDTDFSARLLDAGIEKYASLGWRAAELVDADVKKHPERRLDERWLNYYSATPFQTVSYLEALTNKALSQGFSFSNKVVFVGETHGVAGYVGEQKEEFHYPWTWRTGAFFDGVQVHALTFSNLVNHDWLRRLPVALEVLAIALIGAMLGYGLSLLRPLTATVAAIVFCVFFGGAAYLMFARLFSDIANFSKASEMLQPSDLAKLLNDYYEVAIAAVHKTDGTVMNIIGDAIFAIWNAPQEQKDHQKLACEAAVLLNQRVVQFNAGNNLVPLRTRIGLHTGIACVGNIGSTTHFDYAAIGENVNMASRLEGLNKILKTNILATREIQSALDNDVVSRRVGYFRFKGLVQINEVHELIGPAQVEAKSRAWREAFADALACLKSRQWDKAEERFRRTLKLRPKPVHAADDDPPDGPSDFYLKLIPEFKKNPPAPEWLGEVDLREK